MREYRTRQHYAARMLSDNLTRAGAEGLANIVRAYWFKKGKFPNVNVVRQTFKGLEGGDGLYCVRSDMISGVPQ